MSSDKQRGGPSQSRPGIVTPTTLRITPGRNDLEARFWAKVDKNGPGGCWLWTGTTTRGYGLFRIGSRTDGTSRKVGAHRFAYELLVGPIPDGLQLDHLCHNRDASCPGGWGCPHRRCVNPAHLEPVTSRVNTLRGKTNGAKARCPKGHPYDEVNTYVDKQGRRHCRPCERLRTQQARARQRRAAA